jgi:chromosome segregation ATPase
VFLRAARDQNGSATVAIFGVRAEVIVAFCALVGVAVTLGGGLWWISNLDGRVVRQAETFLDSQKRQYTNIERIETLRLEKEKIAAELKRVADVQASATQALKDLDSGGSAALKRLQDDLQRLHTDAAEKNKECATMQSAIYDLTRRVDQLEFQLKKK